jgi:uncharacterized protein DUF3631
MTGTDFSAQGKAYGIGATWQGMLLHQALLFVRSIVSRHVSMSDAEAVFIALWVAHTFAFEASETTPYLAVLSPERQCGKTRLFEVLQLLVAKPTLATSMTPAALVREVEAERPTLLLDELDAMFAGNQELAQAVRGILNGGYRASGTHIMCTPAGGSWKSQKFRTFCPKALAGIGKLPDTVADRCVIIRLRRAPRHTVKRFREREVRRWVFWLAPWFQGWAQTAVPVLRDARPEIPDDLDDRKADVCEPLLAIADMAGFYWHALARKALVELCAEAQAEEDSIRVRLLADIKAIFKERKVEEISSGDLADALAKVETSPWGEWSKGKPLSTAKLAGHLKPFSIRPDRIGGKNSQARGYKLSWLEDAFSRYLPPESVNSSTDRDISGSREDFKPSTESAVDASGKSVSASKNAGDGQVDALKVEIGGNEASAHADDVEIL